MYELSQLQETTRPGSVLFVLNSFCVDALIKCVRVQSWLNTCTTVHQNNAKTLASCRNFKKTARFGSVLFVVTSFSVDALNILRV
jgi:hypothetical protein